MRRRDCRGRTLAESKVGWFGDMPALARIRYGIRRCHDCGRPRSPRSGHQRPNSFLTSTPRSRGPPGRARPARRIETECHDGSHQAGVDVSFRSMRKPVPAILRSGRTSKPLPAEQAARIATGVERPCRILLGIASGRFASGLPDRTARTLAPPPPPSYRWGGHSTPHRSIPLHADYVQVP